MSVSSTLTDSSNSLLPTPEEELDFHTLNFDLGYPMDAEFPNTEDPPPFPSQPTLEERIRMNEEQTNVLVEQNRELQASMQQVLAALGVQFAEKGQTCFTGTASDSTTVASSSTSAAGSCFDRDC